MSNGEDYFVKWWWKFGIPAQFWITYQVQVKEAVEQMELPLVDQQMLAARMPASSFEMAEVEPLETRRIPRPRPLPGGLRFAHLHLGDDIYKLNREQWQKFSEGIVKDFKEKLDAVGTVSFRQVLELGEVMSELD